MEQVWNQVKSSLKETLGPQNYAIWIRSIQFVSHTADQISLQVPNRYYRDWVQSNYGTTLQNALAEQLGYPVTIRFQIGNEPPEPQEEDEQDAGSEDAQQLLLDADGEEGSTQESVVSGVAPDKIFSNFVVGACNQFAHAASLAVAESPGDAQYNPLFIYGSTGLGKTHLLHAIGNHIKTADPGSHILYVTAERFTNDLIDALRYRRMSEFRERYRKLPTVLLMDDVQFLTGKDRTQEELFHTFEWLKERGRQIVFTSDVLPSRRTWRRCWRSSSRRLREWRWSSPPSSPSTSPAGCGETSGSWRACSTASRPSVGCTTASRPSSSRACTSATSSPTSRTP